MLKPFTLLQPTCLKECVKILKDNENVKMFAGGTDVFVDMHKGQAYNVLVDVKLIPNLDKISFDEEKGLKIGAAVALADIAEDPDVIRYYNALSVAINNMAMNQIRQRGTIAGNICTASAAADTAGPLLLFDAVVNVFGEEGEREIPIDEFFVDYKKTALGDTEIVTGVTLPKPLDNSGSGYAKLTKRGAAEIGIMSGGAMLAFDADDNCIKARITMAAVNPTPIRVTEAEDYLVGKKVTADEIAQAAEIACNAASPKTWRNAEEWSKDMVKVYVPMAISAALENRK